MVYYHKTDTATEGCRKISLVYRITGDVQSIKIMVSCYIIKHFRMTYYPQQDWATGNLGSILLSSTHNWMANQNTIRVASLMAY